MLAALNASVHFTQSGKYRVREASLILLTLILICSIGLVSDLYHPIIISTLLNIARYLDRYCPTSLSLTCFVNCLCFVFFPLDHVLTSAMTLVALTRPSLESLSPSNQW